MPTEVQSLVLNVKSDSVSKGASRLKNLATSSKSAESATNRLSAASKRSAGATSKSAMATGKLSTAQKSATASARGLTTVTKGATTAFKSLVVPISAAIVALQAFKKLVSSTVELQDFQAQLKTATGSAENATRAFAALEDFATRTPYRLGQSVEAFIKLTNLGLTPSERALTSYGNTASAMGKDLTQLIEAVADAATGEFERLKEFGIKARSEGENVSFTFRGVTKTIGKNAAEIEKYLIALGEHEFAGAMSERMETLGGKLSNLSDAWDGLWRTISEKSPIGDAIKSTVETGIAALEELRESVLSLSGEETRTVNELVAAYDDLVVSRQEAAGTRAFSSIERSFRRVAAALKGYTEGEIELARVENQLNPLLARREELEKPAARRRRQTQAQFERMVALRKAELAQVNRRIKAIEEERKRVVLLHQELGKQRDVLAEIAGVKSAPKVAAEDRDGSAAENMINRLLVEGGINFGGAASKSFLDGLGDLKLPEQKPVIDETRTGTAADEADPMLSRRLVKLEVALTKEEELRARYGEDAIKNSEERLARELQILQDGEAASLLKKQEYLRLKEVAEENHAERVRKIREASQTAEISATANLFTALATLEQGNSERTQRRKKAFAITAATINTYQGASQALNEPGMSTYVKLANAAIIVANGLQQVQSIRDAGNYATGGIVPGTSFSGDQMQANVNSGEMILTRQQQGQLFKQANGQAPTTSGNAINVTIQNYGSSQITAERIGENEIRIIARDVVREDAPAVIAADLGNPNSRTSNALARSTNVQRRR